MTLPSADVVIAALRRSRHIEDAARELGIGKRSVSNVLERAGVGTPGQYLYGVAERVPTHPALEGHPAWESVKRAPLDAQPVSEQERRECEAAKAGPFTKAAPYTGAPPPDFDDVAETRKTDPIPPPESGPGVAKCEAVAPPAEPFREERILFIPDAHWPYCDHVAWGRALRVGQFFRPHRLQSLGDAFDFYPVSSHDHSPTRQHLLAAEIAESQQFFTDLDSLGAERKHIVLGNHEHRLDTYIARRAPALHGLAGLSVPELFHFADRGWQHAEYWDEHFIGKLRVCHDYGDAGPHAAKRAVETVDADVVIGHTHRRAEFVTSARKTGRIVRALSFGWLGQYDSIQDYKHRAKAMRDWEHCCGVGWTRPDGSVRLEAVQLTEDVIIVDGQRV